MVPLPLPPIPSPAMTGTGFAVLYTPPHSPVGLRPDKRTPVEVHWTPVISSGLRWKSGQRPVKVRSKSGQSLIQCENDRTCMSGRTPPDSGRTLTGLSSFLTNHTSMYPNCSSLSSSLLLLLLSSIHLCYISI